MADFTWFDFEITGDPQSMDEFLKRFEHGGFASEISYNPDRPAEFDLRKSVTKLYLSSGGIDNRSDEGFEKAFHEYVWKLAEQLGLKIDGGLYLENDMGRWRGSFDEHGQIQYRSINWVVNDLRYDEVEKLREIAEILFEREFPEV